MANSIPGDGNDNTNAEATKTQEVASSSVTKSERDKSETISLSKTSHEHVSPASKSPQSPKKRVFGKLSAEEGLGYEFSKRLMALAHHDVSPSSTGLLISPHQRVGASERLEAMELERDIVKIDNIGKSLKRRKSSSRSKHEAITRKNSRGKLTIYQLRYLERKYKHCQNPEIFEVHGLAKALHLSDEQVKDWFLNRRRGEMEDQESKESFEYSQRLLSLARVQSKNSTCWSAGGREPAHCCHCVQSFECFWPRSNLQTIRMHSSHSFL